MPHEAIQTDLIPMCIVGSLLLNHIDHSLDGLCNLINKLDRVQSTWSTVCHLNHIHQV